MMSDECFAKTTYDLIPNDPQLKCKRNTLSWSTSHVKFGNDTAVVFISSTEADASS